MYLVTGANGFIGRNLLKKMSSKRKVGALVRRKGLFGGMKNVVEIKADITDKESLKGIRAKIDGVIHLAGIIDEDDRKLLYGVNVGGTKNLIEWCEERSVNNFVFISSLNVKQSVKSDYADSKKKAEEVVENSTLDWSIIRPSLVYGPGDKRNLGNIINWIIKVPIIPIIGSGKMSLRPLYVEDLTDLIVKIKGNIDFVGKIIEIAGKEEFDFESIVVKIAELSEKRKPVIIRIPLGLAEIYIDLFGRVTPKIASSLRAYFRLVKMNKIKVVNTVKDLKLTSFDQGCRATIRDRYGDINV